MVIQKKIIDLRSDTVTKPCKGMLDAMAQASSGDEGYYEDDSTLELESYCAQLFGKEAALFMISGTMSNQVAIRCYTQPGDEIILDKSYHINYFEAGPTVDLGHVYLNLCHTTDGLMRVIDIEKALIDKSRSEIGNEAKLICLENTINTFSGKIYPFEEIQKIFEFSRKYNLAVHLDGARLLNACATTKIAPRNYAQYTDSLTICFSKGLGAPFGSILMSTTQIIEKARKYRKWYGGGLHQSGYMAAAALYAIKNNCLQLEEDNHNAKLLANLLQQDSLGIDVPIVDTNIVMLNLERLGIKSNDFLPIALAQSISLYRWSLYCVRAVTHKGITTHDIYCAADTLKKIIKQIGFKKHIKNKRSDPALENIDPS